MGALCPSPPSTEREDLSTQWTVGLKKKPGMSLGLELDFMDGHTARVLEVLSEGAVRENGLKVKQGDHIVSANGARDSRGIMRHLQKDEELEMVMEHPRTFKIQVSKGPGGLGIDFTYAPKGDCLLIRNVLPRGAIHDWNEANQAAKVKPSDRIVEVNGVAGAWSKLVDKLKADKELSMVISPCPAAKAEVAPEAKEGEAQEEGQDEPCEGLTSVAQSA
mmetsp:Transcript_40304/g.90970  ORF Transcript_40304/g.90970 Transcript_40304/m.90970 type:complete len:219 (-) Transcript_40304:75-731(-)